MNIGKENEKTEFKKSTSELHQGIESIASMLNKHGYGELFFGVSDNGDVIGQIIMDSTIKTVADGIMRDIEPKIIPTIDTIDYEGKSVLKVSFSGNQKPYSAFGKFQIRVGTQNRQMTRDELRRLIKQEDYSYPWEKEQSNCSLDDIDDELLHKYYDEAVNCGRLIMPSFGKESLLAALDLYHDGSLNNAAIALFGKKASVELKMACYATDDKVTFTDLNSVRGSIYTLINTGITYILNHINWRAEINHKREDIPEIPVKAIREIVVNAFAHAIYEPNPEIEINIYPSMITIFNPGSFPDELTPQDFVSKNISSVKRNPLILDILYRCKDVEKPGTGFKRMNEICIKEGIKWDSMSTAYGFMFTFFRPINGTTEETNDVNIELTDAEKDILNAIQNNPKITRENMANDLGKSVRTIQRTIKQLTDKGLLIRIGSARYGYWEVKNK